MENFRSTEILRDYISNNRIEPKRFFELRIAAALQTLVDVEKSKCVRFMDEDEYHSRIGALPKDLRLFENALDEYEKQNEIKIYDINEITLFGKRYLKFNCYDESEVDFS